MIIQKVYLKDYDWIIKVYYAVDRYYTNDIIQDLKNFNIKSHELSNIKHLLNSNTFNIGFTYSDYTIRKTIIVIGLTSSASEFQNTFDHEKGHAAMHIGEYYQLNPYGEDYQYLAGEIGKKLFPYAKMFLCDHCRKGFVIEN